jgi:hypothetical protein
MAKKNSGNKSTPSQKPRQTPKPSEPRHGEKGRLTPKPPKRS